MTLEKIEEVDKIEVLADGQIQVRQSTIITEDGKELSRTFHRHVLAPGDDVENEDARVQAIAMTLWTDEVIEAYRARALHKE